MVSIKDVAKHAKVAPSTVSLVLNKTGYVSEKTREKVETSMKELNYIPNELARNLYHNRTNMIGIIPFSLLLFVMRKYVCINMDIKPWYVRRSTERTVKKLT